MTERKVAERKISEEELFSRQHKIYARHSGIMTDGKLSIPLIKRCISLTLQNEGVDVPCEISVMITDDEGIRKYNNNFRGVDKATDVLSFPMHVFSPGSFMAEDEQLSPETGMLLLGDIILSANRVRQQAREFRHSPERETAYLTIHSVLHLLGYDHADEAENKQIMRGRETEIIKPLIAVLEGKKRL